MILIKICKVSLICIIVSIFLVYNKTDLYSNQNFVEIKINCILFDDESIIETYTIRDLEYLSNKIYGKELENFEIVGNNCKNITFGIDKEINFYYRKNDDGNNFYTHEKYTCGYPDGTFRPQKNITWAEAVFMLYSIKDIKKHDFEEKYDLWYEEAMSYFKKYILVDMKNEINPNFEITKNDFTKIAMLYTGAYIDDNIISTFLQTNSMDRTNFISRAESVWIINKLLNRNNNISTMHFENLGFSDIQEDDDFYGAILEACYTHEFIMDTVDSEKWINVR